MNNGLKQGMRPHVWQDYEPVLDVWNNSAGNHTPALGTPNNGAIALGRFLHLPESSLVVYNFQLFFSASGASGGKGNYLISLPVPAKKWFGGEYVLQSQIDDKVLGQGHASFSLSESPQVPLMYCFADFPGLTYGGRRESWVQAFCPGPKLYGTGLLTAAATSINVVWPGAITLTYAPQPSEIQVVWTSAPVTTTGKVPWITNVSSTGFTLNVETAPGTGGLNFAWTVQGSGTLLLGGNAPWNFGNPGDNIKGSLIYEAEA
jgi:hypothetical protein